MADQKQVLNTQVPKGITATRSNERLRGRSERAEEYTMNKGNYDPTRKHLNFKITPGGKVHPVDTSRNIPGRMVDILERCGIKDPNEGLAEPKYRTVVNLTFGDSCKRMHELMFGTQNVDFDKGVNDTRIKRMSDIERRTKDAYSFVSGKYGEQNIAAFIVHLDELNPHVHYTSLPIEDGCFAYKEILTGKGELEYSARMKQLHTDFSTGVNTGQGMSRGTNIFETGARYRTTEGYRRMLSEECTTAEESIDRHQKVLATLQSDIRLAERRVKGFTTMVDDLEKPKVKKRVLLSAAEQDLKANRDDAEQLTARVKSLEKELAGINRQLANKQEKLQTADRQFAELKENMGVTEERTGELKEETYKYSHDIHSRVGTLLKDVLLEDVVGEYRNVPAQMDMAERQLFDGSLVRSIAEQSTDVMHCATMLFLDMADDAITFTGTRGGGGGGSDLKWGCDEDEGNHAQVLRDMRVASRMIRPAIGRKPRR